MSEFTLSINTDNAAFDGDPRFEVARILNVIASGLENGSLTTDGPILIPDINGNAAGVCQFKDEEH